MREEGAALVHQRRGPLIETKCRLERVGLVVHGGRQGSRDASDRLIEWLRERAVFVRSLEGESSGGDEQHAAAGFADGLDLVVSIGGDGTLLRAARMASEADVPVLALKVGRVGFLTELEPAEAPTFLSRILEDGTMLVEERMAIEAHPDGAPWDQAEWALNEVIVEKRARHRLITLAAFIGDEHVTTFSADGVIVATPTGSTAYSFSARGPIVSPRVPSMLLTPVSPHMVFDRSMVLSDEEGVLLEVGGEEPGLLSADGRPGLELPIGSRVRIERSARPARLVRRPESPSFFSLLREKFSLPGQAPHG
ncbi:MAG TPA: NAD(+)/NADH kinase [Actinomycetota bacterium]|jgi:NAD+ kinase|nr:NAD(+)/NADH kinase [Actinomycetota bacterium]